MLTIIVVCGRMLLLKLHDRISHCDSVPVKILSRLPSDLVESLLGQPVRRNKDGKIGLKGLGRWRCHNEKSVMTELNVTRSSK